MPGKLIDKNLPTRERILKSAKKLFQQRGYYAVGTAEILDLARAPKGSMYHHFPDGKEQIAIESVITIRNELVALLETFAQQDKSVAEMLRELAKGMAHWLKESHYREGTMLASTTVGSVPDLPKLHRAIKDAFDEWRDRLSEALITEDWSKPSARKMSQTIIAAIEGAMILARIDRNERVIIDVIDSMARVVADGERMQR